MGLWVDWPGQIKKEYIHDPDELVIQVEGKVEVELEEFSCRLQTDKEFISPAETYYTIQNIGKEESWWFYSLRLN